MNRTEKRELLSSEMEIREIEGGLRTITGYAVKWEMKSVTMGYWRRFKEQFKRGAFTDSLTQDDQLALWSHDYSQVLGSTKNGTLRLFEDEIGLRFELDLADTTLGDDTYKTIRRGDVDGVSFGFQMVKEEWDESNSDNVVRSVTKAKLIEISPVAFPAYPDSQVSARSHDPYKQFVDERNQKDLRQKLILKTYL
ncbi:HK97 family phage prohead protease [Bacillus sp. BR_7]|uniref:HK97 family phage prohead protease n=1 Tax=Bacillus sp. BR_7 TaxID=3055774 RepID=UPI0035C24744